MIQGVVAVNVRRHVYGYGRQPNCKLGGAGMTIDVEHYRDHIEKVLANLGEGEWILWTKDSVEGWAESVNLPQRGAFIPAMAVRASDGRRILVIRRLLTDDIRNGVLGGFLIRGRGDQKELEEPLPFLE